LSRRDVEVRSPDRVTSERQVWICGRRRDAVPSAAALPPTRTATGQA